MRIRIENEQELVNVATEALHVLSNLRHFTKKWNSEHGYELRQRKQYYEELADALIQRLQITEHRIQSQIKIEVNASTDSTPKSEGMEDAA